MRLFSDQWRSLRALVLEPLLLGVRVLCIAFLCSDGGLAWAPRSSSSAHCKAHPPLRDLPSPVHHTLRSWHLPHQITKVMLLKGWRCVECIVCEVCGQASDPSRLLLCDDCDISYHTYCLDPPLLTVPKGGWKCKW